MTAIVLAVTLGGASSVVAPSPVASGLPAVTAVLQWSHVLADRGAPIAESSPTLADLGGPSAVVGDRAGNVFAFHLSDGSVPAGWPADTGGAPVDSTPSSATVGNQVDVFVGSGNAANPGVGGYQAFGPDGQRLWFSAVGNPPTDPQPGQGVQASLSVATLQGTTAVVAGSLGQQQYALDATGGAALDGWPFFTSDSVFSTAAIGDLYGTGHEQIVDGGDQTAGFGRGQQYQNGGHVRILDENGGLVCHFDTDQTVDSSPAIGGFLAGGAAGIVDGTGAYFPGASASGTVIALDSRCRLAWSARLDGSTFSSPALADVLGNGGLQVVEGTDNGSATGNGGSVWALAGDTGQVIWSHPVAGRVIGSVVTADLTGSGGQDVLVPTTAGVFFLSGRTGQQIGQLTPADPGCPVGFQNSPLVTDDPNGSLGITVAGYDCNDQGVVEHYEISGQTGRATEAGGWPMFHHDPGLSGDAGGLPATGSVPPCDVPAAASQGYDLVGSDGGVFAFGGAAFCGSTAGTALHEPIVGMARDPVGGGYWLVAADGGVFAYGGAPYLGSMGGLPLNAPIVGMAPTPDGLGYWLVAADGGVFGFGDAGFLGSMGGRPLNAPIVGIDATADGLGYRLAASDGGVFGFGDAQFFGSMGGQPLNAPIVGMATDVDTGGYWLVGSDGGVFAFEAPFLGSMGGRALNAPIVGVRAGANGAGYRFVAADGGGGRVRRRRVPRVDGGPAAERADRRDGLGLKARLDGRPQ